MKLIKIFSAGLCAVVLSASPVLALDKTCCQKAATEGKECTHKCCVSAHRSGKSCEKCNPHKEDLKLSKNQKKSQKQVPNKKTTDE